MDINKLIARAKAILLTPKTEWPVIAAEPTTVADLYKNWIVILAAIPAVAGFIKSSIIGTTFFGVTYRAGIGAGLTGAIIGYALALVVAYVMALIIDALAPNFGGEKNPVQALKTIAYASTASWVAGVFQILPWIGTLLALAGGIYAIYLLYLGLPHTMKAPKEKAVGYTAVTVILGFVLAWISSLVVGGIIGASAVMGGGAGSLSFGGDGSEITIDKDSALGKLDAWSKKMEAAGQQMEAAKKSGDADAQAKAMGAVLGTALGGGDQVEALAPDMLKPFVPDTLAGLPRTEFSAERNGALGMQVSEARATYADDSGHSLRLEVTDMGSAKGLMAMAGWAALQQERETATGYEKTYKQGGRLVHESWDHQDKYGEYSIVLGDRFTVKLTGNADSIDQLRGAVASINLAGLEALKAQGVKQG